MSKIARDSRGRFVSTKATSTPPAAGGEAVREALTAKSIKLGITMPSIVVDLVVELTGGSASPNELEVLKPTPKDPVILYRGEPLVWFFPVKV